MFEEIFFPQTAERYRAAPPVEQRERYLVHLRETGARRSALRKYANDQLSLVRLRGAAANTRFCYNTGARVSEATQLKVSDLQIGRGNGGHDLANLHGKGGKTRQCPLWPETERVVADEILGRSGDDAVFVSRLGTPFTRFGVYRLIERCAAGAPELADRAITPHGIRHTTACHLVLAGVDINTIRAWLGHVSISTTNIYAEIDLTLKANAVALCEVGQLRPGRSWKEDKDLMTFLKSL